MLGCVLLHAYYIERDAHIGTHARRLHFSFDWQTPGVPTRQVSCSRLDEAVAWFRLVGLAVVDTYVLRKARWLIRDRGVFYFVRFALGRLFVRRLASVVYEYDLATAPTPPSWNPGERLHIFDAGNLNDMPDALQTLLGGEHAEEYLRGVRRRDLLFSLEADGQFVHYGFILFDAKQLRILGQQQNLPLIANCYTVPSYRGNGCYPRTLRAVLHHLGTFELERALIETHPENIASRRGIEKAGFRLTVEIRGWVIFNNFMLAWCAHANRRRLRLWSAWYE